MELNGKELLKNIKMYNCASKLYQNTSNLKYKYIMMDIELLQQIRHPYFYTTLKIPLIHS